MKWTFAKEVGCSVKKFIIPILISMTFLILALSSHLKGIWPKLGTVKIDSDPDKNSKTSGDPAIVWYTYGLRYLPQNSTLTCHNGSRTFSCGIFAPNDAHINPEAYLFYGHDVDQFPLPRNPKTIWALYHEETPIAKPMFMFEKALNLFNYSSTFSRHSDVPLMLFWMRGLNTITDAKYFIPTKVKNAYLRENAPVMFFQSNCFTFTERDSYVKKLMKYINVDCFGACLHNKELPPNNSSDNNLLYDETVMNFTARYKFAITIENAVCKDYMTEKLWRAIELGVVPIYFGSPLIRDWLPNNKSAILLEDFPTPKLLSEHLNYLLKNDTAYEEYLEHKTLGLISNQRLIDEMSARGYQNDYYNSLVKFECFICERLHDKDSNQVNIVTQKHYDCPLPTSALILGVNFNNAWLEVIDAQEAKIDAVYKEIEASNRNKTRGTSTISWIWNYIFYKFNGLRCNLDFIKGFGEAHSTD